MLAAPIPEFAFQLVTCAGSRGFPARAYTLAQMDASAHVGAAGIIHALRARLERALAYLDSVIGSLIAKADHEWQEEDQKEKWTSPNVTASMSIQTEPLYAKMGKQVSRWALDDVFELQRSATRMLPFGLTSEYAISAITSARNSWSG